MIAARMQLGEAVSEWLAERPRLKIVDMVVTQSSDSRFHCVAISVFYNDAAAA